jgi:hypothetical protein
MFQYLHCYDFLVVMTTFGITSFHVCNEYNVESQFKWLKGNEMVKVMTKF